MKSEKSKHLRVGTILRLPWWSRAPRATVVGFVPRAPSCGGSREP